LVDLLIIEAKLNEIGKKLLFLNFSFAL